MNSKVSQHFLFPHLTLTEKDYRHLSILLPHLFLLEITRAPEIPAWAQESFAAWPVVREIETQRAIQQHLQGYQTFASVHGENALVSALRDEWADGGAADSRFHIQHHLKGKDTSQLEPHQQLFQEAAVFMELARSLDESETELERNFGRVAQLEEEFRQIIGAAEGEEPDPVLEVSTRTLMSEKSHLAFMLPVRMSYWFRLFRRQLPEAPPILVGVTPDVAAEILDRLTDQHSPIPNSDQTVQVQLVSLPSLEHLPGKLFKALRQELTTADRLQPYWGCLREVLANPSDRSLKEPLNERAEDLQTLVRNFCKVHNVLDEQTVNLHLTHLEPAGLANLWATLDKRGFAAWDRDPRLEGPLRLLSLQ